ncbi:MAG: hypothetical protein K2Q06_00625 [Parvularculaceae bacterium]|nr:hypothetical protein [Parvularculaceae bacterium]
MTPARQLALPFSAFAPAYARDHFAPPARGPSPLALADAFAGGTARALTVTGPPGSGKTYLGRIALAAVARCDPSEPLFADALERCDDPDLLLTLLEASARGGPRLVLAGRGEPRSWARGLVDLETRLEALPRVALDDPDDSQMQAVLARAFADRQLRAPHSVVAFAAKRLPPRFSALHGFVDAIEEAVAAGPEPMTLALAKRILAGLSVDAATA